MSFRILIGPYSNTNFPRLAESAVLAGFFAWPRQPRKDVSSTSAATIGGASPQTGSAVNSREITNEAF